MKIGFVAKDIHCRGGMERAAAEVLARLCQKHEVVVAAEKCELPSNVVWLPVKAPQKPAVLNTTIFRHRTARLTEMRSCDVVGTIGSAAIEADVVTAQFCHAAFTDRYGGIRGGSGIKRAWQFAVQKVFVGHERRIYTCSRLKQIIAVSRGTARELCEFYGVDPKKITVIPNAVDHKVFRPPVTKSEKLFIRRNLGIEHDGFLAVFVGGDWDRKGVADVIRAVGRTPDIDFVVVGGGDVESYQKIARDAGAGGRVRFVGSTKNPERWLAAGDVYVSASKYEAFSLVIIEAAASGLPLVLTKINGAEDLVVDGVNGFFVESDVNDIASKLAQLRDDQDRRVEMAKAALNSSLSFTWEAVAAAQELVYLAAAQKTFNQQGSTNSEASVFKTI